MIQNGGSGETDTHWMSEDMAFTLERTSLFMRKKTGDEREARQRENGE